MAHLLYANCGELRLSHLTKKKSLKVEASHEHELVGVHILVFDYECYVGQSFIIHQGSKVGNDSRRWNFTAQIVDCKVKSKEIIEALRSIITSKNVHGIVMDNCHVTESMARLLARIGLDMSPFRGSYC